MLMLLMSWLDIILPLLLIFHWRRQLSPRWINPQVKGPGRAGWFVTGWDTSPYIYATDSDTCSHCSLGCQNLFWLGMKASDYAGLLNINTTHAKRSWGDRSYAIDTDARHHFSDFVIFSKEDVTKKNRYRYYSISWHSDWHKGLGLRKVLKKVLKKALKKILLTQKRTQKSKCTFLSTQKSTQ